MSGFPAARVGDPITHDGATPCGTILPAPDAPATVIIQYQIAAHVGALLQCTGVTSGGVIHPPGPPVPIITGANTVLINYRPAARVTPSTDSGACQVLVGIPGSGAVTVLIGDDNGGGSAVSAGHSAAANAAVIEALAQAANADEGPLTPQTEALREAAEEGVAMVEQCPLNNDSQH